MKNITNVKNVAIVQFPLNNIGGIVTWNKHIQKGFRNLGIEAVIFHAHPGKTFRCDENVDIRNDRYTTLAGYHLNYNDDGLEDAIDILNSFDLVIYSKGSPHPTKYNLGLKGIENWPLLYHRVKVPRIMVFHDAFWDKTNGWLSEVAESVDICIAAQNKFIENVGTYPAKCMKYKDYFPIDFEGMDKIDLTKKTEHAVVTTQWVKKKNHYKFFPNLHKVKMPIDFYGNGIEWYYIRKTNDYRDNVDELCGELKNPKARNRMLGQATYPELQLAYAKAFLSIDLSSCGYTNYTHFEPLMYRTLSFMERTTFNDKTNLLPGDCCVVYDMPTAAESINEWRGKLNSPEYKKIASAGEKFIKKFDCASIAQNILNAVKKL